MGDKRMLTNIARKEAFMEDLKKRLAIRQKNDESKHSVLVGFNKDVAFTMCIANYDNCNNRGTRVYLYDKVFITVVAPFVQELPSEWMLDEFVEDIGELTYMFSDEIKEKYGNLENAMKQSE